MRHTNSVSLEPKCDPKMILKSQPGDFSLFQDFQDFQDLGPNIINICCLSLALQASRLQNKPKLDETSLSNFQYYLFIY